MGNGGVGGKFKPISEEINENKSEKNFEKKFWKKQFFSENLFVFQNFPDKVNLSLKMNNLFIFQKSKRKGLKIR